ncbi:major facilitator superfamily domain-containing protein [Kockovaella imperatae]|uniref:Major facilitator superfamily domain-containing protein n=1 Tax=Kockovaella imperatae TaxID=4999 RepID=A0A1Y1UVD5_9TREE|nr:major facilitator superfamily domain-containing protein [Kockovaella imperatae]ORX41175.1 major facilitator superfamily domain-containing protein [Kockovaella imperatae]
MTPIPLGESRHSSSPNSSSSTLMSVSEIREKTASKTVSVADNDALVAGDDGQDHFNPPVPITTLDEGARGMRTVFPPVPLGGSMIPVDVEDEETGSPAGDGDVKLGGTDVEAGPSSPASEMDIFDRFTPRKKKIIVGIVSFCAFIAPICSSIFLPSIPQIAEQLHSSSSTIAYTVAIFIVVLGISPLIWSPLSGFYGRRFVYLISLPILVAASFGVARSQSVGVLIGTRVLQAIGGSCVLAVGAGSIGDIYKPTERGSAMGWYYSGALMGPTFAPVLGGLFSEYTRDTWRSAQYFIGAAGATAFLLVAFILPETAHPPLPHDRMKAAKGKRFVFYRFNPFTSLGLFRWMNVCAMSLSSAAVLLAIYTVLVPMSTLFKDRYHISNLAILGCLYLPSGLGNLLGARIAGPMADRTVKKYIKKRGYRRVEDRLRSAVPWGMFLLPASLITYGWLVHFGAGGIAAPLAVSVLPSMALMGVLTPQNTYLIDSMPTRSAEVIAVNNFLRYMFSAGASAWVLPMASRIGWGWTMTVSGFIVLASSGLVLATLKWGDQWRESANEKYHYEGTPADCRRPDGALSATEVIEKPGPGMPADKSTPLSNDSDHGEDEEVGHLPLSTNRRSQQVTATQRSVPRGTVSDIQMPPMHEVLSRTVSLSGASAHGGG